MGCHPLHCVMINGQLVQKVLMRTDLWEQWDHKPDFQCKAKKISSRVNEIVISCMETQPTEVTCCSRLSIYC